MVRACRPGEQQRLNQWRNHTAAVAWRDFQLRAGELLLMKLAVDMGARSVFVWRQKSFFKSTATVAPSRWGAPNCASHAVSRKDAIILNDLSGNSGGISRNLATDTEIMTRHSVRGRGIGFPSSPGPGDLLAVKASRAGAMALPPSIPHYSTGGNQAPLANVFGLWLNFSLLWHCVARQPARAGIAATGSVARGWADDLEG